jgi:hypothetical protein
MSETFRKELEALINRYSIDSHCEAPDFILADYLCDSLQSYRVANSAREKVVWP